MQNSIIFDFETLSQSPIDCAIVSCAMLEFDMEIVELNGYTYEELLNRVKFIKFDVKDQVDNWGRTIESSTLDWWKQQSKEALQAIKPSKQDVSILNFFTWFTGNFDKDKIKFVFTRNNTFDPVIVMSLARTFGVPIPYNWWKIRDTKSFISGLVYGSTIKDDFIPPDCENKYVKHDPRHDIVLDVMRLQTVIYHKFG